MSCDSYNDKATVRFLVYSNFGLRSGNCSPARAAALRLISMGERTVSAPISSSYNRFLSFRSFCNAKKSDAKTLRCADSFGHATWREALYCSSTKARAGATRPLLAACLAASSFGNSVFKFRKTPRSTCSGFVAIISVSFFVACCT